MFTRALTLAGQVRRFTIREIEGDGWEVREERDSELVRRMRITDWHRVERELHAIAQEVIALEARGWMALA